jgi:hypothetical protein
MHLQSFFAAAGDHGATNHAGTELEVVGDFDGDDLAEVPRKVEGNNIERFTWSNRLYFNEVIAELAILNLQRMGHRAI